MTPQDPPSIDAIIDSLDGGPAFPQPQGKDEDGAPYSAREIPGDSGMSLRDWFAGMALSSMDYGWFGSSTRIREMAEESYNIADAMLAARKADV